MEERVDSGLIAYSSCPPVLVPLRPGMGGGGDSNMKTPRCVCQESEIIIPILNNTFSL